MRINVSFKPRVAIFLVAIVATLDCCSTLLLFLIDRIIHIDLYMYGLTFSSVWAEQYWIYFRLAIVMLLGALITAVSTLISVLHSSRSRKHFPRATALLPILSTTLNLIAVFLFSRLDYVVHNDLYFYGLTFSIEWASNYWTYASVLLGAIGLAVVGSIISFFQSYFSQREEVEIEKIEFAYSSLIVVGAAFLTISIVYTSTILAFIGLGLLFWGILLAYIRTEDYVKRALLEASLFPAIETLDRLIAELGYKGTAIYLPPKYFKDPDLYRVFIPKGMESKLPTPKQVENLEEKKFLNDPQGILIEPPGAGLARLFEKILEISFTQADLPFFQRHVPRLIVEDLEIAKALQLIVESNRIVAEISSPVLDSILYGAIACALAKTSGRPIIIEKQKKGRNNQIVVEYNLITKEQ